MCAMTNNPNQPRPNAAILGGQNPEPISSGVLGGLQGVQRRLARGSVEQRIAALSDALNYGRDGLKLLLQIVTNETSPVQWRAYDLLWERASEKTKQKLLKYLPTRSVIVSDSAFNDTDWELITLTTGNGGTVTAKQKTSGGNPGEYRYIFISVNYVIDEYTNVCGINIRRNLTYNPQVIGSITSINYSEDSINFADNPGQGQAAGIVLRQNGKLYLTFSTRLEIAAKDQSWINKQLMNLKAVDFIRYEDLLLTIRPAAIGNNPAHPDFSAKGGIIEFGFFRWNSTQGGGYTTSGGIANWSVSINCNEQS